MMPGTSDTCTIGSGSKYSGAKQRLQSLLAECLVLTQLDTAWRLRHLMSSRVPQLLTRCLQNAPPATSNHCSEAACVPFKVQQWPCMLDQGR